MMHPLFSSEIYDIQKSAETLSHEVLKPRAETVDEEYRWPEEQMKALADSGLLGLHVPIRLGGKEQGLLALAVTTEALGRGCSSSAMCFGMHSVATAVIAAKSTRYHDEVFLSPIAQGKHVTTLALSEHGTGAHFYLPQCELQESDDHYIVNGSKHFITNGGHADSYVVSTKASPSGLNTGEFTCLLVEKTREKMKWLDPWKGFGMRGNSSRGLCLDHVSVPKKNLLGLEGDQIWYVFEVVAPFFLTAMAGVYLGIAQAALDYTIGHLKNRHYQHSGESLAQIPSIQYRLSELWLKVEEARGLLYLATARADKGDPEALIPILMSKVASGNAATQVTQEALALCGGSAYRDNADLSRLIRDASASHVMSPTTDILKGWAGKSLLGLPLI